MSVENVPSGLVPQGQMASDHVSSDPAPQCSTMVLEQDSLSPGPQSQENVPQVAETATTSNELELLYSPMFSELLMETYHKPIQKMPQCVMNAEFINIFITTEYKYQGETRLDHVDRQHAYFLSTHPSAQTTLTKDPSIRTKSLENPPFFSTVRDKTSARNRWPRLYFELTVSRTEPQNIKEAMAIPHD
ncbi:hypothetical protein Tco_1235452 [Tanacetum coccineum]